MESVDDRSNSPASELNDSYSPASKSSNPAATQDILDDLEKMKGDSIGDTLYSSRFVLKALMKLTMYTSVSTPELDGDFEKDLCILWDMTIEGDVVKLLLEHNVLELFISIIQVNNYGNRLTEILVGIIGNMCALSETRSKLCDSPELMSTILSLVASGDSLTLIQLMRLLHAALVFENCGDEMLWLNHFKSSEYFVKKFSFMMHNSINSTLLVNAYEALNSICTKFAVIEIQPEGKDCSFIELFVQPCLVSGVVEAFKVLVPDDDDSSSKDDSLPTKSTQRIMSLFLDINVILSQYSNFSRKSYQSNLSDVLQCISKILEPLCNPMYLFPVTTDEQGFIENTNEIFQALGDPFHGECLAKIMCIHSMIDARILTEPTEHSEWENDFRHEEIDLNNLRITILELLMRLTKNGSIDDISNHVQDKDHVAKLLKALKEGDSEPDIHESCLKLDAVINKFMEF